MLTLGDTVAAMQDKITRLEAMYETAEADAKRQREKYEGLRGLQNTEITRLEAVNAELVEACRVYMARQRGGALDLSLLSDITEKIEAALAHAQAPAAGKVPTT